MQQPPTVGGRWTDQALRHAVTNAAPAAPPPAKQAAKPKKAAAKRTGTRKRKPVRRSRA